MFMRNKSENNGKDYKAYRQFILSTAVLMGANNDNDTIKAVDEVIDFHYKIGNVSFLYIYLLEKINQHDHSYKCIQLNTILSNKI